MEPPDTHPAILRIWQAGLDESRADEYREFARRNSAPMFSAQPGFLGVVFAAAPGRRAVVTIWETAAAAAGLAQSRSYRDTVGAIEAAGFLDGPRGVCTFEIEAAFLRHDLLEAVLRDEGAGR